MSWKQQKQSFNESYNATFYIDDVKNWKSQPMGGFYSSSAASVWKLLI